jgi:uncharacterized protein YndB with AHSA1/START domain
MSEILPLIEETEEVAAPPATVWKLVSDLPRIAEWSPQVVKTIVNGRPIQLGSRMFNINRKGLLVWPTRAKVVRFEPQSEIAFRIKDNATIWSFTLEPTEGGTLVTHRREAPHGTTTFSDVAIRKLMGGQKTFQEELRVGMRQTLAGVKAVAEA